MRFAKTAKQGNWPLTFKFTLTPVIRHEHQYGVQRVPASGGKDCSPSVVINRASTATVNASGGPGRPRRLKTVLLALR